MDHYNFLKGAVRQTRTILQSCIAGAKFQRMNVNQAVMVLKRSYTMSKATSQNICMQLSLSLQTLSKAHLLLLVLLASQCSKNGFAMNANTVTYLNMKRNCPRKMFIRVPEVISLNNQTSIQERITRNPQYALKNFYVFSQENVANLVHTEDGL